MRIPILTVSLLLTFLASHSCNAVDFLGDVTRPVEIKVVEKVVYKENCIDFEKEWATLGNITVCTCPLCLFQRKVWDNSWAIPAEKPDVKPVEYPKPIVREPVAPLQPPEQEIPVTSHEPTETSLPEPFADAYVTISDSKECNIVLYVSDGCVPCQRMKAELQKNFKGTLTLRYAMGGGFSYTGRAISKYPTAELFYKKRYIGSVVGYVPWSKLQKALDNRIRNQ